MGLEALTVQFLPEVEDYLLDLAYVLYRENYFGFLEDAFRYVDEIVSFAESKLPTMPFKNTPENLKELGSKYIFYRANQNTAGSFSLKILKTVF